MRTRGGATGHGWGGDLGGGGAEGLGWGGAEGRVGEGLRDGWGRG